MTQFNTVFRASSIKSASWLKTAGTYTMTLKSCKETHTSTSGTPCIRATFITGDGTQMVTDSVLFTDKGIVGFDKYLRFAGIDLDSLGDKEINVLTIMEDLIGTEMAVKTVKIEDGRVVVRDLSTPAPRNVKVVKASSVKPARAKKASA